MNRNCVRLIVLYIYKRKRLIWVRWDVINQNEWLDKDSGVGGFQILQSIDSITEIVEVEHSWMDQHNKTEGPFSVVERNKSKRSQYKHDPNCRPRELFVLHDVTVRWMLTDGFFTNLCGVTMKKDTNLLFLTIRRRLWSIFNDASPF